MTSFQIRLRTPLMFHDITYIQEWLDKAESGFAFEHDKPDNHHYHIYLFGLNLTPDPMRKRLGRYMPSKEHYMVGVTAGKKKEPLNEMIAYQYGTTDKLLAPVWIKGFENKLDVLHLNAEAFYDQQRRVRERKQQVVTEIMVIHEEKQKQDRVWQGLMSDLIENPTLYDDKLVHQIKSMISASYLRKLKAVPRPSDLHRYAVSLYHIVKWNLHTNPDAVIPDTALEEEYLR